MHVCAAFGGTAGGLTSAGRVATVGHIAGSALCRKEHTHGARMMFEQSVTTAQPYSRVYLKRTSADQGVGGPRAPVASVARAGGRVAGAVATVGADYARRRRRQAVRARWASCTRAGHPHDRLGTLDGLRATGLGCVDTHRCKKSRRRWQQSPPHMLCARIHVPSRQHRTRVKDS